MSVKSKNSDKDFPPSLFRYRSLQTNYALDEIAMAINDRKIYLSSAENLNDPFDFRPTYRESQLNQVTSAIRGRYRGKPTMSKSRVEDLGDRNLTRNQYRKYIRPLRNPVYAARLELKTTRQLFDRLHQNCRVACLSETGDNIPMWAHYTSDHSGVCIEYSLDLSRRISQDELTPLAVGYSDERPEISTVDLLVFTNRAGNFEAEETRRMHVFESLFLHKASSWSYEKEWRLFEHDDEGPGYRSALCLKVESLTLGIRASKNTIVEVKSRFGSNVPIRLAIPSESTFSISYQEV